MSLFPGLSDNPFGEATEGSWSAGEHDEEAAVGEWIPSPRRDDVVGGVELAGEDGGAGNCSLVSYPPDPTAAALERRVARPNATRTMSAAMRFSP